MVAILGHLTRVIAGIPVPNSPIVNATIAYAHDNLPTLTYNHVMRTWLNGQAIINNLPAANISMVDQEVFAVAAILHDMGWSEVPGLTSDDKRFEVDGADVARSFVQREGGRKWNDKNRQRMIWDAIALHGISNIAAYKEFEVALVSASSLIDLAGPTMAKQTWGDLVTVTQTQYDRIRKEFPGTGQRKYFLGQLVEICRRKPETTYDNFVGDFGEKYVANYSRVGHRPLELIENLWE